MAAAVHDVQRVGVPRLRRPVGTAHVWKQTVQNDQRSLSHFEREQSFLRPGALIEDLEACASRRRAHETRFESELVSSRNGPQAAVLQSRVFEGEPEPQNAQWLCVEETGVLMTRDLAADVRLLEDIH